MDDTDTFALLETLPARVTRKVGADLISQHFFPVRPRTLERSGLPWQLLNNKAVVETRVLFEYATARVAEAPAGRGRRPAEKREVIA